MQTNILVLERIQSKIIRGDIKLIAESTGFTRQYVGEVLSTQSTTYNEFIVNEAVKVIGLREQNTKKNLKKLSV